MSSHKRAWVAATLDTKSDEAEYVCGLLEAAGLRVALVDLSTAGTSAGPSYSSPSPPSRERISATEIAAHHPQGQSAVFTGDRGAAIAAMTDAFEGFVKTRDDI